MEYRDYNGPRIESIDRQLLRFGLNPYGLPRYRFVLAEKVLEIKGGKFRDWDPSTPVEDRGTPIRTKHGLEQGCRPISERVEYREVQRYDEDDKQGWIFERWCPRTIYGSPEAWEERVYPGTNICVMGPYPREGRYEWAIGPFKTPPSVGFLLDWITWAENNQKSVDEDAAKIVRERYEQGYQAMIEKMDRVTQENAERLKDAMSPIMSSSLAAGRWRSRMAEKAGFRSHIGN